MDMKMPIQNYLGIKIAAKTQTCAIKLLQII